MFKLDVLVGCTRTSLLVGGSSCMYSILSSSCMFQLDGLIVCISYVLVVCNKYIY